MTSVKRILTGSAVALGLAATASLVGVGSPAADAFAIGADTQQATVLLELDETRTAGQSMFFSETMCYFDVMPQVAGWMTPLTQELCTEGLYYCSRSLSGVQKAKIVFIRDDWKCSAY